MNRTLKRITETFVDDRPFFGYIVDTAMKIDNGVLELERAKVANGRLRQGNNFYNHTVRAFRLDLDAERLKLEKERFELEKERFELEKQKKTNRGADD